MCIRDRDNSLKNNANSSNNNNNNNNNSNNSWVIDITQSNTLIPSTTTSNILHHKLSTVFPYKLEM